MSDVDDLYQPLTAADAEELRAGTGAPSFSQAARIAQYFAEMYDADDGHDREAAWMRSAAQILRGASTAEADARERQRLLDGQVLDRAQELDEDDSPQARQVRADADRIAGQRRREVAAAVAAGVKPCPAAWSRTTPCVHPDGDGHVGQCFAEDEGGGWSRASSWFTPEAREQTSRRRDGDEAVNEP